MQHILFLLALFALREGFGLYLLRSNGEAPECAKRAAYHEVLLKEDYPMCLAFSCLPSEEKINQKLARIDPRLKAEWVPTALFQLFVLHYFFTDPELGTYVKRLGYSCRYYDRSDPEEVKKFEDYREKESLAEDVNIDKAVIEVLADPTKSMNDLFALYDEVNHRELFCNFFLKVNDAFLKKYSKEMLGELLKEIPCELQGWKKSHFPFVFSSSPEESMEMLLQLFSKDPQIISRVIEEERKAHEEGKHLIYRGGEIVLFHAKEGGQIPLLFLPLKGARRESGFSFAEGMSSFSLSYGSSFLGGLFLVTDACAARYCQSSENGYAFHALGLDRQNLIEDPLFCIPFFHPFVEMFVDGEWFHPHAKIARKEEDPRCYGWYAKPHRMFTDHLGFVIRRDCSPEALGAKLLNLAAEQAVILGILPEDFGIDIQNHRKPVEELVEGSAH